MSMAAAERNYIRWLTSETPNSATQARAIQIYSTASAFAANRLAMVGLGILLVILVVVIAAPLLATTSPIEQDLAARLLPPSAQHWFGTDQYGRDLYSRVIYGSRVTLLITACVLAAVGPIGLIVGCISGYWGGWVDRVMMRITDIFLGFPKLILALALVSALGPGLGNAMIAIALTSWPAYARTARSEALILRENEYINAARILGAGSFRIVFRHVMPLCLPSVIVRLALDSAGIILTAAALGFLGLGAQPPLAEWGTMISDGREFLLTQWWVATFPGIAICVASLAFNLVGDGLRDLLDPRGA
ncbi:MAG TPA: nickel transporter permease [Dongiaceae bacterium]|jgi:peptide/nickel transport system permease protein